MIGTKNGVTIRAMIVLLLAATLLGSKCPSHTPDPDHGGTSVRPVPPTDGLAIMMQNARSNYAHQFPAHEVSAQKRLTGRAAAYANPVAANALITVELLKTDFKSP